MEDGKYHKISESVPSSALETASESRSYAQDSGDVEMASRDTRGWDQEEHIRFMHALEAYGGDQSGDEWRKIAACVQTRSIEEVRVHGRQYLQHLMQLSQSRPHQHLQQQQQTPPPSQQSQQHRLLQLTRMSHTLKVHGIDPMQYPLPASRELSTNNQNDLNGPNQASQASSYHSGPQSGAKLKTASAKARSATSPSPLSIAALSVANAMNGHASASSQYEAESPQVAKKGSGGSATEGGATKRLKEWSFQEDKVLETALAAWQIGKPYSWPKIAATLPGKTAKDVRLRYDQLVEDIANINENGELKHQPQHVQASSKTSTLPPKPPIRPPHQSGLRSRISPPPPIQVPPPLSTKGKSSSLLDSPVVFPASARGTRLAMAPNFIGVGGMLSPTFLDFLANEDKQPLAFSGGVDLPSPLLPSPSRSGSGRRVTQTRSVHSSGDALTSPQGVEVPTPSGVRRRQLMTPRGSTTPRIWQEFLSEDFKLFDGKSSNPSGESSSASNSRQRDRKESTSSSSGERRTDVRGTLGEAAEAAAARRSNDIRSE